MAKLSVYKTIDRSQLGGKFVPLIQSGVSNYKILASDLGKEYHPGDAIEITDTGEINVKFHPFDFDVSSEGLTVKTDAARGVFKGSDGVYIASANDSIGISRDGIKVNTSVLAGYGLESKYNNTLYVKSADSTISVNGDGISVYYGSGLRLDDQGRLSLHNDYLSHYATVRAGHGLYWYHPGYPESALYVKSANNSILVGESGLSVHAYALIDKTYLSITPRHVITVDKASVARAITGSGLVTTNGAIGVNVNTATGIIVKDNKLYLNAGNGLQNTNNIVKVKAADSTINVSSAGIKVNTSVLPIPDAHSLDGLGLRPNSDGRLDINPSDNSIYLDSAGVRVNTGYGLETTSSGLYVKSADSSIRVSASGVYVNAGYGLVNTLHGLIVKPSDGSIFVNDSGVGVDLREAEYVGAGLTNSIGELAVKASDGTIGVSSDGIKVRYGAGLTKDDNGYLVSALYAGSGVKLKDNYISLHAGDGLEINDTGAVYVKSADGSINVNSSGIGVALNAFSFLSKNSSGLSFDYGTLVNYLSSGYGLRSGEGGALYVQSADGTISVDSSGISVYYGSGLRKDTNDNGKLSVYLGSGLYFDSLGAICSNSSVAYVGDGLVKDGETIYIRSSDNTILASDRDLKVWTDTLAGIGLGHSYSELYVMSADDTIEVSSSGIKVNASAMAGSSLYIDSANKTLNVSTISLAGDGLNSMGGLNVVPADSSIKVSSAGVKVNVGYGLETTSNGIYVKSADNTIDVTSDGIKVNTSALNIHNTILGVAVSTPNNQHAYASADGSIAVGESTTAGGANSVAIGRLIHLTSDSTEAVAIGYTASATGERVIAIGSGSYAKSGSAVAIGNGSIGADRSAAVGAGSEASGTYSLSAGYMSRSKGPESVALGVLSVAHNSGTAIGSTSYSMSSGVAVGYNSRSHAYAASFGCSSSSDVVGVSIGYQASAGVGSVAIGYQASAYAGMVSIKATYSSSATFSYLYGPDGSIYSTDTLGNNYSRSWANLLTPPDTSTVTTINSGTTYTADKPLWLYGRVFSNTTTPTTIKISINETYVLCASSASARADSFMIPVAKGSTYKIELMSTGSESPYLYKMYCK